MKVFLEDIIGRHVPLALVASFLLQGATAVWWISAKERDLLFLSQRVTALESGASRSSEAQNQTLERLARIEERVNAQLIALDRIEKQVSSLRR